MGVLHQSLEQSPEPTPDPQPRDWLQMYWRCISWTSHCWPDISTNWRTMNLIPADVTWHQFLWYFWFEGRVVRCLSAARKTSTVAKQISFPKQPPLIIAAYTPVKQWKISLEENAAPVLSRIWVLQAVPALALVRLPEVNVRDQQITSPWCTMGTAL